MDADGNLSTPESPMSATTPGGTPSGPTSSRPWGGRRREGDRRADRARRDRACPPPRVRRGARLQPRSGSFGSRRGDPNHSAGTETLDQDRERLPPQPHNPEPQGDQQDRLDEDRPSALRPLPRPSGLPQEAPGHVGCFSGKDAPGLSASWFSRVAVSVPVVRTSARTSLPDRDAVEFVEKVRPGSFVHHPEPLPSARTTPTSRSSASSSRSGDMVAGGVNSTT